MSYNDYIIHVYFFYSVTEECSWTPCPRFGYCDKITASCHCEVGFEMKEKKCAGINTYIITSSI